MLLAGEETRKEHDKLANRLGHIANEIADVTHFTPDPDEDLLNLN